MAGGRDASQSDFGGSSSSSSSGGGRESYGGGGQYSAPSAPSSSPSNDRGRDPTVQYQNTPPISTEAKEALEAQRQKAQYEISPMTDPKNRAIATGLSLLIPGAGSLYGAYKNATAMGYSIQNPFEGLLGGGEITLDKVNEAIERGDGNNFNISEAIASAPSIIQGNTQQPSVAAAWYKNLGTTSGWDPFSTNSLFANARAKQQSILGTATGIGQIAVNESPFFNFLKDNSINKGIL
jgi:hypothetical protein